MVVVLILSFFVPLASSNEATDFKVTSPNHPNVLVHGANAAADTKLQNVRTTK